MIPIHPELARALKAGPVVGMHHLITNAKEKPYSALTDMIEAAVGRAVCPTVRCPRAAQGGATAKQIAAISGHKTLALVQLYTEKADQAALAQSAIAKLKNRDAS
jgi:hypothetical protein